jgi:hypothetical protein
MIAPRTRPYIAATAGVASSSYRVPSASRGPTMNDAHVPADAVPATRASHDARAISFAQSAASARPLRSRPFDGNAGSVQSSALHPVSPSTFPAERRPFTGSSPLPPTTPRPLGPTTAPEPIAPRSFSPPPAAPRPFAPPAPAPIAPRTFTPPPSPAPIAPRPFTPPAPIAPRSFSPPPSTPHFSPPAPAPVAPRSFSPPAPVAPRSFAPPVVRSMPAPPSARSFGGRR